MSESRELTTEEVRDRFLTEVRLLVDYWYNQEERVTLDGTEALSIRDKMEELAFSILSTLDGSSISLPAFIVAPDPHPNDREFCQKEGFNWYPENDVEVRCDIAGGLHEHFYSREDGL